MTHTQEYMALSDERAGVSKSNVKDGHPMIVKLYANLNLQEEKSFTDARIFETVLDNEVTEPAITVGGADGSPRVQVRVPANYLIQGVYAVDAEVSVFVVRKQ